MKYLSTGEFASLCRTRKDTLLFYDKEGLLKPRLVSENGYRRYHIGQFYEFDMVAMLKESLRRFREGGADGGRHLGLRNVDAILRLHYGPEHGLRFLPAEGRGTCVMISLPAARKEEREC